MGHDKLRKFAENETFSCLLQPSAQELLADGYFHLRDHAVKGRWSEFFSGVAEPAVPPADRATLGIVRGGTASEAQRWGPKDVCRGELPGGKPEEEIILELGCGKGEYTVAMAEKNPEKNYIGVDIKGARLWKGAKYVTERGIPNAAFLRTRIEFITAFFAPGEVSEIWLTFSDPQIRSENSRLSSPLFLERYRQFLRPGGIVHLKTDSRFLFEYTLAVCRVNGLRILAQTTDLYGTACAALSGSSPRQNFALRAHPSQPDGWAPPVHEATGGHGFPGASPTLASQTPAIPEEVREVQTFYEKMFLEQGYPICYLAFTLDHEGAYAHPRDPEDFDAEAWRAVEGPRLLFGHDSAETRRQKLRSGNV